MGGRKGRFFPGNGSALGFNFRAGVVPSAQAPEALVESALAPVALVPSAPAPVVLPPLPKLSSLHLSSVAKLDSRFPNYNFT